VDFVQDAPVPIPHDEEARLDALRAVDLLDTPSEERFDRITRLLGRLLDVPIAVVNFVDADRQWGKSCVGVPRSEAPRTSSFCAHAIMGEAPLVVPDTSKDRRFTKNPLVTGEPHIRAYAGQPVHAPSGHRIGTLCVADRAPRAWSDADLRTLHALAAWVEVEIAAGVMRTRLERLAQSGASERVSHHSSP
jgi:GAF domain-containing protein